mgnify:CR=1 FL=1
MSEAMDKQKHLISSVYNLIKKRLFLLNLVVIFLYAILIMYKLGSIPNLFVDEVNYANEVISFANFGTDIHGLHFPVYFSSVWGQGQSVLYAVFAYPFVKLFGFSIFIFRLPFAILTIVLITSIFFILYTQNKKLATFVNVALVTTPWIFISGRWILDANIAPIMLLFGTLMICLSVTKSQKRIFIILGAIFISVTTYGYIASWLYLPILCLLYLILFVRYHYYEFKDYILLIAVVIILIVPILIFSYHSNILHSTSPSKFLFFDIPPLPSGRASSLIDFSNKHLFETMLNNFYNGVSMYFSGSDKLPWNSVQPFGAIYPWLLLFVPFGAFCKLNLTTTTQLFRKLVVLNIMAFLPLMFIIIPNYNHWNFLNINFAILVGFGFFAVAEKFNSAICDMAILVVPIIIFGCFLNFSYFGLNGKETFYNQNLISYGTVKRIDTIMEGHNHKLYVNHLYSLFPYFRLVQKPIDSQTYLKKSSQIEPFGKTMGDVQNYGYLEDMSQVKAARRNDLALVSAKFSSKYWKCIYTVKIYGQDYKIVERI